MSWANNLQDATFRDVPFEVISITDEEGRDLSKARYPYRNGAELADMGLKAKEVKVRALLRGEEYEQDLDALYDALRESGPGYLIHPIAGAMTVQAETWHVEHNTDIVDGCVLSITFVEDGLLAPVFSRGTVDEGDLVENAADEAMEDAAEALQDAVDLADVLDNLPSLNALESALSSALETVQSALSFSSLQAVLSGLDVLQFPLAWASDFIAVIDRALQGLPFGGLNGRYDVAANNPSSSRTSSGRSVVVGAAGSNSAVSGVAASSSALRGAFAPITLLQPLQLQDFNAVQRALAPAVHTLPVSPRDGNTAPAIPDLKDVDRAAVQAFVWTVCACHLAKAATIVLAAEPQERALSIADVERVATSTRTSLKVAIDQVRIAYRADAAGPIVASLKTQAVAVQDLALAAIRLRPPLVTRLAPEGGHWRLIAHRFYGDAARAGELMRLNHWGRRVLVAPRQEVSAYAR